MLIFPRHDFAIVPARALQSFCVAPWLPRTNYDTLVDPPRLDRPLLVNRQRDADQTVPRYMGRAVFDAAPRAENVHHVPETQPVPRSQRDGRARDSVASSATCSAAT